MLSQPSTWCSPARPWRRSSASGCRSVRQSGTVSSCVAATRLPGGAPRLRLSCLAGPLRPAPRANAIAECWIASASRECLDRMLITGERHLRLVLTEYADHYNVHRPHRTLCQRPPAGREHPPAMGSKVRVLRRDRLGGLIREYAQVA